MDKHPWKTTENLLKLSLDPAFCTAREVSKYGVFSGSYFPAFGMNTEGYRISLPIQPKYGKYGPEKTPCLDSFHVEFVFK